MSYIVLMPSTSEHRSSPDVMTFDTEDQLMKYLKSTARGIERFKIYKATELKLKLTLMEEEDARSTV